MFSKLSVVAFGVLASLVGFSHSAALDVYSPPLTAPTEGQTWAVGTQQQVTWDTSNPPRQITNRNGTLYVSQNGRLLDLDNPLAQNFDLMSGKVTVTVPNFSPACDYQLVLVGDSGNAGPKFCINSTTTTGSYQ